MDEDVAQEAAVFTVNGKLIASSPEKKARPPDQPDADLMRRARDNGEYAVIDTLPDKGLTLLALVTVNSKAARASNTCCNLPSRCPSRSRRMPRRCRRCTVTTRS